MVAAVPPVLPNRGDRDTEKFRQERGSTLRAQLGVEDASRLADRELRNSWTHFDERMDYMLANGRQFDRQGLSRLGKCPISLVRCLG
jgi:hypothetical protein